MTFINQIPITLTLASDPYNPDFDYYVWEQSSRLVFEKTIYPISDRLRSYYSLGCYIGEVYNGGHSQLCHNMDIGPKLSPFLFTSAIAGANMIGAKEFAEVVSKFQTWMQQNSDVAAKQTGFEGGRDAYLDVLDEEFAAVDMSYREVFVSRLANPRNPDEKAFLEECVQREKRWRGDLNALILIWIHRNDLTASHPDVEFKFLWEGLFAA